MKEDDLVVVVFGLICFVHSLVLSFVILSLSNERHDRSKNWLSALMLILSFRIGKSIAHLYLGDVFPQYAVFIAHGINFFVGPVLLIYYTSIRREQLAGIKWHFLPGALLVVASPWLPMSWWQPIYVLVITQTVVYLFLTLRKIESFPSFENVLDTWKTLLFLTVAGVSISYFLVVLFDWDQYVLPIFTYAILVYIVTLFLIKSSDIKKLIVFREKYNSSKLSDLQRKTILDQLNKLLDEEQLYRNPELNLKTLSGHIGIPESYLSQTISTELQVNFNELINRRRIADVCESLKQDKSKLMNIEQHAFANGFNSMSAFYKVFKEVTGVTPAQYRKESI